MDLILKDSKLKDLIQSKRFDLKLKLKYLILNKKIHS